MKTSKRIALTLIALCPAAVISATTASGGPGGFVTGGPTILGGILVGTPGDTVVEPPSIELILDAWGTSTGNADVDANGIVDGFDLLALFMPE
ncbi:MAG: hypothetical protein GY895_05160 [Phycisphaera sp.]|nr:hypothetical protein [Phycisphaera sp.]